MVAKTGHKIMPECFEAYSSRANLATKVCLQSDHQWSLSQRTVYAPLKIGTCLTLSTQNSMKYPCMLHFFTTATC